MTQPDDLISLASFDPSAFTTAGRPVYGPNAAFPPPLLEGAPVGALVSRWAQKANAYALGWEQEFRITPSLPCVILGLSVAQHETWCGDAWPSENNWGAVQLRSLSIAEQAVIASAGLAPAPQNVAAARTVLGVAVQDGRIPDEPNGALHVDSSPGKGWYWAFFHKFPTAAAGADFFVRAFAVERIGVRAVLEAAVDPMIAESYVATHMYLSGYYEGVRTGARPVRDRKLPLLPGEQANVDDYTRACRSLIPGIQLALSGWAPPGVIPTPVPPTPPTYDLSTTKGYQAALKFLAVKLQHPTFDPGDVDGAYGPKTEAAVKAFQAFEGIGVDGIVGDVTRARIQAELDKTSSP